MKRQVITAFLLGLLIPSSLMATPVATFGQAEQTNTTKTLLPATQLEPITVDSTGTLIQAPQSLISASDPDIQQEIAIMKELSKNLPKSKPTVNISNSGISLTGYNNKLDMNEAQYYQLYEERLAKGNLPIRYLPNDYSAFYNIADKYNLDNTVVYEIIDGYPIFYKVTRYSRPESYTQVSNLPDKTADQLDVPTSGSVGTLLLK